jgi:hypothetical protein
VTADEAVVAVLDAFVTARVPYMVVGSLASNFYGIPRATRDPDFVVELAQGSLARLSAAFPLELVLQPQVSFEGLSGTTRHIIALVGSPFVCELFVRSEDPHDQARFGRRQQVRLLDRSGFVTSAEDVVIT